MYISTMGDSEREYILSLDIGTTIVKCHIYDKHTKLIGHARKEIHLLYPKERYVEINPDELWKCVMTIIKEAIKNAQLTPEDIKCIGITTLRSTFTTWKKSTGHHLHNFITWKDQRAEHLVKEWNQSITIRSFRALSYFLYLPTRSSRFLTGSRLKFSSNHTTPRLAWILKNIPEVRQAIQDNDILFGTVDSWLIYKLTGGKQHVIDVTNASGTGLFDPFLRSWGLWTLRLTEIPGDILPKVVPCDFDYGCTDEEIFGVRIPIKCVVADQSAAMFGNCCFNEDDIKMTLGTGGFLGVNTGVKLHTSASGMYPLIGWEFQDETVCMAETTCNDVGSLIEWAIQIGLAPSAAETATIAFQTHSTDGVYFIPSFTGLGPPICNENAACGFLGIKPTTKIAHMMRAILESIVYKVVLSLDVLKTERPRSYRKICLDGGVSKNDFICQLLADLTGLQVERAETTEITCLGAAFMAGLAAGVWKNKKEIKGLRKVNKVFNPSEDITMLKKCREELKNWLKAVERFKSWY